MTKKKKKSAPENTKKIPDSIHIISYTLSKIFNWSPLKSHIFSYNMKYSTEMPSICIFVCMKMFVTAVIKDEHTSNGSLQSDSSFMLRNIMMTDTTSS